MNPARFTLTKCEVMSELNVIIPEAQLLTRVQELGAEIARDYAGRRLDIICCINGGSKFCADLVRHIPLPVTLHYLGFSTYAKGNSSGEVRVTLDVAEPLQGRHVLVVEGIVVSGRTPAYIMEMLKLRQPASLELCALGVKPKTLAVSLPIRHKAFELGSQIAVGYGVGSGPQRSLPCLVEAAK
jgi:hypoxanthine phosphoribosyltransferase